MFAFAFGGVCGRDLCGGGFAYTVFGGAALEGMELAAGAVGEGRSDQEGGEVPEGSSHESDQKPELLGGGGFGGGGGGPRGADGVHIPGPCPCFHFGAGAAGFGEGAREYCRLA